MFLKLILFLQLLQVPASDNINEPIDLPRLNEPIEFDGFPNDAAWQQIDPLPLVMYQPVYRGDMTERTEIKVAYDDDYLYVAGLLYDSEPDKIVENTLYRDRYSGDETFAIILDSFNDNENAKWFFVTPAGVRVDMQVSNDADGGFSAINSDWNTFWDVETQITDEGWFVEMRIPFSSLGFREVDEEIIMGMITYRYIARKAERHIFPDIPPDWSMGFVKPSQAQKISIRNINYNRPLYITPYLLGGVDQFNTLNREETAFERTEDGITELGLDIRYPVTGNMNLDITLNTDFAQVEADEIQINLTRFPLFFPEKRQFFQERSNIFNFSLGGNNTLFHSRRIGLVEGQQVRILGGARLAGRTGKWDIGLLNMQTDAVASLDLSSENFGVLRLRRDVINMNSYAGTIITSRIGRDGSSNIATGADFVYNYSGNDYLDVRYAATFDNRFEETFSPSKNGIFRLSLDRRTSNEFFYNFTYKRAGEHYTPEMGFELRDNFTLLNGSISYGYFNSENSSIRTTTPSLRYFVSFRNTDETVESMLAEHSWNFSLKSGSRLSLTASWWHEDLRETLQFSDQTFVEPGSYSFYGARLDYDMTGARSLSTNVSAGANTFFDGSQLFFSINPTWNQSKYLELGGEAEFNILNFEERNQKEYLNIYRFRSLIALNTKISLQLFTQYNLLLDQIGTNARFRYNFREGNDLWIVYNETTNTNLDRFTPNLPRFDNRLLLVKYTYTFY